MNLETAMCPRWITEQTRSTAARGTKFQEENGATTRR
jgi:hypothetical protein